MRTDPCVALGSAAGLAGTGAVGLGGAPAAATPTKDPAWKAWTYQRRLEAFATITPEPAPEPLPPAVLRGTVLALLDVRAGRRPWRCLDGVATAEVLRQLQRPAPTGRLRRIRVCVPDPWSLEVAAIIARPDRVQALALRWDWRDGAWMLTAVEG